MIPEPVTAKEAYWRWKQGWFCLRIIEVNALGVFLKNNWNRKWIQLEVSAKVTIFSKRRNYLTNIFRTITTSGYF
jgi:hypothetical protein